MKVGMFNPKDWDLFCRIARLNFRTPAVTTHILSWQVKNTKDLAPTHLSVCPLMQFCTFLFEQSDRARSDPVVTPPAPHS